MPQQDERTRWDLQQILVVLLLGTGLGVGGNWAIPDRTQTITSHQIDRLQREVKELEHRLDMLSENFASHNAVSKYWIDRIRTMDVMHSRPGVVGHPLLPEPPRVNRFPSDG